MAETKEEQIARLTAMYLGNPYDSKRGLHPNDIAAIRAVLEERELLRSALIATGRILGCVLEDTVSSEFLRHIPEEARLAKEAEEKKRAADHTKAYDLGRQTGLLVAAHHLEENARMALTVMETDLSPEAWLMQHLAAEIRAMASSAT